MRDISLSVGFVTDTGRARDRNEDAYALYLPYEGEERVGPLDALFVVADGMGGHEAGDQASRLVAATLARLLTGPEARPQMDDETGDDESIAEWIARALRRTDRELRRFVEREGLGSAAGSTATVAAVLGETMYLAHVGDSRGYRIRHGDIEQLTLDHSWVAEQVRAGVITPEEAAVHPKRHMLTQCLGIGQPPTIQVETHTLEPGDRILLCSDGLHGAVPHDVIARVLLEETAPQATAKRLVTLANEAGGPDNITAIVFDARPHSAVVVTTPDAPAVVSPTHTDREMRGAATDPGAAAVDAEIDATEWATSATRPARSRGPARALVLAGALLTAAAVTLGAWHYLEARQDGSTTNSDTTAVPAASDSIAVPDSVRSPRTAVPDTLDTGARQ